MATTWLLHWQQRRPGRAAATGPSWTDIVIAVALSAFPIAVAARAIQLPNGPHHPGVAACLAVIGLTWHVLCCRPGAAVQRLDDKTGAGRLRCG